MKRLILLAAFILGTGYAHAQVPPQKWTQNYAPTLADWQAALLWKGKNISQSMSDAMTAISGKVDSVNGTSDNQKITSPLITSPAVKGGSLDGQQTISGVGDGTSHRLSDLLGDYVNTARYGTIGDGLTDDGPAVSASMAAALKNGSPLIFPHAPSGYNLSSGSFSNETLGDFHFNDNSFSGSALGSPQTGTGRFNSLYTNPWLVVTGEKIEADPAGHAVAGSGSANIGWALECHNNHMDPASNAIKSRMISCGYIGMDTGTDGGTGTTYSSENLNEVLNLSSNSGTSEEIDVNFNGYVADGGWSRGLFITGGGKPGNQTNSVALDIQHIAYDGSLLPWSTGISVREATTAIQTYARLDGQGFLYQGYDRNGSLVSQIDNNGYFLATGITSGNITLNSPEGSWQNIRLSHSGKERWEIGIDPTTMNDDLYVSRRNADGNPLGIPLRMSRSSGLVSFESGIATGGNVCLDMACTRYVYEANGKIYLGNVTNGNVASFDDSGNMIIRGRLIQNGTP